MRNLLLLLGFYSSTAARVLFVAAIVVTPWILGGTWDWTIRLLYQTLYVVAGLWLLGWLAQYCGGRRGSPWGISTLLLTLCALTAALGWFVTLNAHSFYDSYLKVFMPIVDSANKLPGTVDEEVSRWSMNQISGMLIAILFSSHLAARPKWRQIVLTSIAFTGISLAVLGIAQKISGSPLLYWKPDRFDSTSFSMYRYHGNAASYLNLTWPICAALAVEAFQKKGANLQRAIWLPGAIVLLSGVGVNTAKAGHLIAGIILLLACPLVLVSLRRRSSPHARRGQWILPLIVGAGVLIGLVVLIGYENGAQSWEKLFANKLSLTVRERMIHACMEIARDRPWFGFGPGTYSIVFPFYGERFGFQLVENWDFAHSDYAQTLVEWGWVGCTLFSAILFGGWVRAASRLVSAKSRKQSREDSPEGQMKSSLSPLNAGILLSLTGVAIHAAFDFPLQISSLQLYTAVLLGFAWQIPRLRPVARRAERLESEKVA